MAIYKDGRVERELRLLQKEGQEVTMDVLQSIDCMHYGGSAPFDVAAAAFGGLDASSRVVDVGSGYGGTSRYLAHRYGCAVTAVELQEGISALAGELTQLVGLDDRVRHVCGDIAALVEGGEAALVGAAAGAAGAAAGDGKCGEEQCGASTGPSFASASLEDAGGAFDGATSLLVFLHLPEAARVRALRSVATTLAPGAGRLFIEDYYAKAPLSAEDVTRLADTVACPYVPDRATYEAQLAEGGFEAVEWDDLSEAWIAFTAARAEAFETVSGSVCVCVCVCVCV